MTITAADLIPYAEYERVRNQVRQAVIARKQRRRIAVGDRLTLVFENRETVQFQIQEMIRAERIVDPSKVQEELDVYNQLLPTPGELSATLFIEIPNEADIKTELDAFMGIDGGETLAMHIGQDRTYARFESGHSNTEKISAVHFVRFALPAGLAARLSDEKASVSLALSHRGYHAAVPVPAALRAEWLSDLAVAKKDQALS